MKDLAAALVAIVLFSHLWHAASGDDTNSPDGQSSDLTVYTDYKTGCQYLSTVVGGITPRLDGDGKPICVEPKP